MAEISRIADLRQRVLNDSTSIAFAQLAEELRRVGQHESSSSSANPGPTQPPGASTETERSGSRRAAARIDENDLIRVLRTLTAPEAWLAAIHVARANRHA